MGNQDHRIRRGRIRASRPASSSSTVPRPDSGPTAAASSGSASSTCISSPPGSSICQDGTDREDVCVHDASSTTDAAIHAPPNEKPPRWAECTCPSSRRPASSTCFISANAPSKVQYASRWERGPNTSIGWALFRTSASKSGNSIFDSGSIAKGPNAAS